MTKEKRTVVIVLAKYDINRLMEKYIQAVGANAPEHKTVVFTFDIDTGYNNNNLPTEIMIHAHNGTVKKYAGGY